MSNRIDQRIVEMSFENAKFEKGILQSEKSLKGFSSALSGVSSAGAVASLKGIEQSLQTISGSFTAVGQIGVGALRQIGAAAVNAGTTLFKSLAIEPITQGFGEMELKMNSTQTIMASTGESLEVVNKHLQALNEYSDQTIYSFSDMTENIGKFTNAGVKLEDAVASIKGISNAAALSGANANEASRAMYNFAQALSSGSVKLLDWKSIEMANMGTVEFKQQLLDAGVAAGTLKKEASGMYKVLTEDASGKTMGGVISSTKNFNDSLANQWMTTKVLTGALGKYADSTTDIGRRATLAATQVTTFSKLLDTLRESVGSGWSQTFEILFGDFNEARELWTGMNMSIGSAIADLADARNDLLSGGLGNGWKGFMQEGIADSALFGATLATVAKESGVNIDAIIKKTGSMEKAVRETVKVNLDGAKNLQEKTNLIIKENEAWLTGDMLTKTVDKMSASIENLSDEQLKNAGYTEKAKKELLDLRDALKSGKLSADEFAKKMSSMSGRENIIQGLKNSVAALLTALRPISKAFDQIFPPMTVKTLYEMTENFKNLTQRLIISEETAKKIQRTFAGLFAILDIGWQTVKFLGSALLEVVGAFLPLNGSLLDVTANIGDFFVVLDQVIKQSRIFDYALLGVKVAAMIVGGVISKITSTFSNFVVALLSAENPLEYLGATIQKVFANIFTTLQNGVQWISTKFFGSLNAIQKFFETKLNIGDGSALTKILDSLKEFLGYVVDGGADGIVSLSSALNSLDFSRIATFVTGGVLLVFINQLTRLTKVTGDLIETTNTFTSKLTKKLFSPIAKFKDLAFAVGVLSASLFLLSTIPMEKLKVGLMGLAGAMVIFTASYAAMQAITVIGSKQLNGAKAMESALSLTAMAGGLAILAYAVSQISKINRGDIWNSVAVVGAMMGIVVAYQALAVKISLFPGTRAANIGMGLMASGLLGLVTIILLMDHIQPEMITQSLTKLAGAMAMLAGIQAMFALAARASGGSKVAVNVLGIAGGILAMIAVIKLIEILKPKQIIDGATNVFLLGGVLAAVQAMFSLASRINGGVAFKTNILSMQLGLVSMAIMASILGNMDQKQLQNGIINLAKMAGIIGALELITGLATRLGKGQPLQKILGSITLTMMAFTGIIAVIGKFEQSTIDQGFAILIKMTGLIMAIELMTAVIGSISGSAKGAGILIGMTLTILTLTASLALLSMIDQEALTQASAALSKAVVAVGIMGVGLGLMINAFSGMSSGFSVLKGIVSMIIPGFIALIAVFGAALIFLSGVNAFAPMLQSLDWDVMLKFVAGMGIITTFIGAFTILSKLPGLGSGIQSLTGLIPGFVAVGAVVIATAAMFAIISKVLPTIDKVSWSSFDKLITGLGVIALMVVGFAMLSPIFMMLGTGFVPALTGVIAAVIGIGMVVGAFAGLASVMETIFAGRSDFLIAGIDKLIIVADGIGRFIGAIVGGFNSEILVGYGTGLAKFSTAVSQIKPGAFDGIGSLAKAMLALTGAALLDGLARFVGLGNNSGEMFGKQVEGLVNAFNKIDPTAVTKFTTVVQGLRPALGSFSKLIEVAGTIPNSGGALGFLMGNNDINKFGLKLAGLVNAFVPIPLQNVNSTRGKLTAMTPMLESLKAFIDVAGKIPNSGWVLAFFAGDNNIDKFGLKLAGLVNSFVGIPLQNVKDTTGKLAYLTTMSSYLKGLVDVAGKIPTTGGLLSGLIGNNSIDKFAERLRGLVEVLYAINSDKLKSAMSNIRQINASLVLIGSTAIDTAVKSLDSHKLDLSKSFTRVFDLVLLNSKKYVTDFKTLGENIVKGLQNGITKELPSATTAADKMAKAVVESTRRRLDVRSPSKVFAEIGTWLPVGLANGITKNSKVAILASANMGGAVDEALRDSLGVHSPSKATFDIGKWLPPGFAAGIESTKNTVIDAAKSLGLDVSNVTADSMISGLSGKEGAVTTGLNTLLDMLTGKTTFAVAAEQLGVNSGKKVTDGMTDGIESGGDKVKKAAKGLGKDAFEKLKEAIDKRKEYNLISIDEEIKAWEDFAKLYVVGTEMRMKADKELDRVRFENSKNWMEKEKYYKRLSLEEELAAWERVRDKAGTTAEHRMEAEREIFRLKGEIWQAEYQHELDALDDAKYYGKLTLDQELEAQKKIRAMTEETSEERKRADREVFRLEKEIKEANLSYEVKLRQVEKDRTDARKKASDEYYKQETEINEQLAKDIESLKKTYDDAIDSRSKTLYSTYGMFDKVDVPEAVAGLDLVKNLEDQTKAFDNWQDNITALAAKGVDEGLINELREMGPKATAQLIALNTLSNVELTKYVGLWQKKSKEAKDQAALELQSMVRQNEATIIKMTEDAAEKLKPYKATWDQTLIDIDNSTRTQLNEIETEWTSSVGSMTESGITLIKKFKLDWYNEVDAVVVSTKKQLDDLQKLMDNAKVTVPAVGGAVDKSLYDKAYDNGTYLAGGYAEGLKASSSVVTSAATNLNKTLNKSMSTYWMIASPSKRTTEMGMYIVAGLAAGLNKFSKLATTAAGGLGGKAMTAMASSMSAIPELFDSGVDEIKITPIVDLSNVKTGVKDANKMLGDMSNLDLSTTMGLLPTTIIPPKNNQQTIDNTSTTKDVQPTKIEFVQNNYSPTALSRLDIYRQTQNQISSMKGMVTT